jgi:hypothetical protein
MTRSLWIVENKKTTERRSIGKSCSDSLIIHNSIDLRSSHRRRPITLCCLHAKNTEANAESMLTTRIFLDIALLTYVVGLGVYLGCVWQSSLDVDAGQSDIHNIFISFCSYTGFCIFLYSLMSFSNHYKREEWGTYSEYYREGKRPESSCPYAINETKNHGQALQGVELKGKRNSKELSGHGRTDEHILECSSCGKEIFLTTTEEVGTV